MDSTRHFEFNTRKKFMGFHQMAALMEKMKRCQTVTLRDRVMTVMTCQMLEPGDRRGEIFTIPTMWIKIMEVRNCYIFPTSLIKVDLLNKYIEFS
jgi:hypothetical protein